MAETQRLLLLGAILEPRLTESWKPPGWHRSLRSRCRARLAKDTWSKEPAREKRGSRGPADAPADALAAPGMCWREGGGVEASAAGCAGFCGAGTRLGVRSPRGREQAGAAGPGSLHSGACAPLPAGGRLGGKVQVGHRWPAQGLRGWQGRRTSPRRRATGDERARGGGPLRLPAGAVPPLCPPRAAAPSRQAGSAARRSRPEATSATSGGTWGRRPKLSRFRKPQLVGVLGCWAARRTAAGWAWSRGTRAKAGAHPLTCRQVEVRAGGGPRSPGSVHRPHSGSHFSPCLYYLINSLL